MKLGILSRNQNLYSTRRLIEAAEQRGHEVKVIDALRCYMNINSDQPEIHYRGENLKDFDFNMQNLLKSEKALGVIKFIKDRKCHCTFECPKYMDVLYNKKFYPKLFRNTVKRIFK